MLPAKVSTRSDGKRRFSMKIVVDEQLRAVMPTARDDEQEVGP
jgi:hypothetical protein